MPIFGKSPVIPSMRYRDAAAAIDWLCRVLGFARHMVVKGEGNSIAHAQLTLGDGMIMLGSERDDAHGKLMSIPDPRERIPNPSISWWTTRKPCMIVLWRLASRSYPRLKIPNTVVPFLRVAIRKVMSGISALTIRGKSPINSLVAPLYHAIRAIRLSQFYGGHLPE